MSNAFIRAKRPDGSECAIDLIELESALTGGMGGEYLFLPESGKIVFNPKEDPFGFGGSDEEEDEENAMPEGTEILPLDPISSHERFRWMESFIETVHSITAQSALMGALRQKKPFRNFKDALMEYPAVRQQWFLFEAAKVKREAIALIESFDWEILEVIDNRPAPRHFNRDRSSRTVAADGRRTRMDSPRRLRNRGERWTHAACATLEGIKGKETAQSQPQPLACIRQAVVSYH